MKISRDLNLVLPVDTTSGTVYVHSTPVSRAIFEMYFKVFRKAATETLRDGIEGAIQVGPATALLDLKDAAQSIPTRDRRSTMWDGPDGVEHGLLPELWRLTNVLAPGPSGWQMVPFQECITRGEILNEDDIDQVGNAIAFFTVFWWILRGSPEVRAMVLNSMASLRGAVVTLSTCTEVLNSLQTSTVTANSGETESTSWLQSLTTSLAQGSPNSGDAAGAAVTTAPLPSSANATSLPH
jgi:hypothetical protein